MDLTSYKKRVSDVAGKLKSVKNLVQSDDPLEQGPQKKDGTVGAIIETASSLNRVLTGEVATIGEFYFPPDVIAGTCPRVVGEEESIVWNAAAEACDSERVHVAWQSTENKIWYLAVRSIELASHPNSWCPFAALLPGMKDAIEAPVCYTYYGDEIATLMTVSSDSLQIYRGTNLVVRAKAERTARELGNAQIVELVPDRVLALTPVPWYSLSLFEDRARRILVAVSTIVAVSLTMFAFLIWMLNSIALLGSRHNLSEAQQRTAAKSRELLETAEQLRASPLRAQIAKFADLNDALLDLNGFLEVYEIRNGQARWRATVPSNITADRINAIGGKTIEGKAEGTVIGNAAEIEYETTNGGNK